MCRCCFTFRPPDTIELAHLPSLITLHGNATHPVRSVWLESLTVANTATAHFAPFEALGGGDQALHRSGAILVEGTCPVTSFLEASSILGVNVRCFTVGENQSSGIFTPLDCHVKMGRVPWALTTYALKINRFRRHLYWGLTCGVLLWGNINLLEFLRRWTAM